MELLNFNLAPFFKEVELLLKTRETRETKEPNNKLFDEMAPTDGECFFVVDLSKSEIVHFGGMKKMFGYNENKIDLPFVFDKSHPDDSVFVQNFIKNIVSKIVHIEIPLYTNIFSLTSRFRKNNGEYIRMLTDNFVIQTSSKNLVQSILIRYTDISFLDDSKTVDWKVNVDFLDKEIISKEVYGEKKNIFTSREKQVVLLVLFGTNNSIIADKLNISKHTVATHRKNIFSKSNCSRPEELKSFCKKNGIFIHNNF